MVAAQATPGPRRSSMMEHPAAQSAFNDTHTGLNTLRARSGGSWMAHFDEEGGAPVLIYGSGIDTHTGAINAVETARAAAQKVLADYADVWGVPLDSLELVQADKGGPLYVFTWQQKFQGLEVRGAKVQIQVHEAGRVAALSVTTVPIPADFSRSASITAIGAEGVVLRNKRLATGDEVKATDFVVFVQRAEGRSTPKLAFLVDVSQEAADVHERVFVDANTGEVLSVEPGRYYFDVKGKVTGTINTAESGIAAPVAGVPLKGATVTVSGVGSAVTDANGDYTVVTANPGPFTVSTTLNSAQYNVINLAGANITASTTSTPSGGFQLANLDLNTVPSEFTTAQVGGAYHQGVVLAYAKSKLPAFTGYNNQTVNVNQNSTCNAFFDPTANSINFYRAGGGCSNTAFSGVVYHEFGHGVDDFFGGINDGGLSEGYGDIFNMYILNTATIGLGFNTNGSGIRTGENTTTWPASNCGGEVHCLGETWMGYAWQVRKKLIVSMGSAPGIAQAELLLLNTLLTNNLSIPAAVTQTFILDDNDGNLLNGTPHYADLSSAAIFKGFTPPQIVTMTLSHSAHPDTYNQTQPYAIIATVAPVGAATVSSVILDWKIDGGLFYNQTAMTPTGLPNQYRANIPAQAGPQTMHYRIRAIDNIANTLTVPSGDDAYRFSIGKKTQLFFDNLDGAALAWTHAQLATQDDWNLGDPQTTGTNAYDPTTPFSGTKCWGNDLQINANQNGLYSANVNNYLESPSINSAGHTGVRLRFRRWLTVESAQFDQATISVNGTQVYKNPQTVDQLDSTWTLQDHPMAMANNLASFKVRWQMQSDGGLQYGGWTIDDIEVYAVEATPVLSLNITPSSTLPAIGNDLTITLNGTPGENWDLYLSGGPGPTPVAGIGIVELDLGTLAYFISGQIPAGGSDGFVLPIPAEPALVGISLYWQAAANQAGALPQISNAFKTTFQ